MNIVNTHTGRTYMCKFENLEVGDLFSNNTTYYIKLDDSIFCNAIDISTSQMHTFQPDAHVKHIEHTLIIDD